MIAGAKFRGEFEDRLKALLKEMTEPTAKSFCSSTSCIRLVGAGAAEGVDGRFQHFEAGAGAR